MSLHATAPGGHRVFPRLLALFAGAALLFTSLVKAASAGDVSYKATDVNGINIFYREAGPSDAPTILLLHGFPSSSHMFRDLIPELADRFHVVAPDYPGYGYSDAPSPDAFNYTFDGLTDVIEAFAEKLGLKRYALYMQDFGGPVGMRLAVRHPERIEALVVQNAVVHEEGLSDALAPARTFWENRTAETEAPMRGLLTRETTMFQYTHGAGNPEKVSPDAWNFDQALLDRPGNADIQLALLHDYQNNLKNYETWQAYLRDKKPPTLIVWGKNDPFFTIEGANGFKREVPEAELHVFDGGHFILEEYASEVAELIEAFVEEHTMKQ